MATRSLKPADIVLVRGEGWLSNSIRFLTRSPGERPTWVSHCGLMVDDEHIVEALSRGVVKRKLWDVYPASRVRIYTPKNVSDRDRNRIARHALSRVGQTYGWAKLVLCGLDGALGGVRLFRRFAFVDEMPFCSMLVASAYASSGYTFGVDPFAATPDDLSDYMSARHDRYQRVQ